MPKGKPTAVENVTGDKSPTVLEDAEGYYRKSPSWRFARADTSHPRWSVLDLHDDIVEDKNDPTGTAVLHTFSKSIDSVFLEGLKNRENMLWSALLTQNGGRGRSGGTNSHHIPVHKLDDEAQKRAKELGLEADALLSLRLDGKKRVYGVMENGVLNIIWFDRNHEICPVSK